MLCEPKVNEFTMKPVGPFKGPVESPSNIFPQSYAFIILAEVRYF